MEVVHPNSEEASSVVGTVKAADIVADNRVMVELMDFSSRLERENFLRVEEASAFEVEVEE